MCRTDYIKYILNFKSVFLMLINGKNGVVIEIIARKIYPIDNNTSEIICNGQYAKLKKINEYCQAKGIPCPLQQLKI